MKKFTLTALVILFAAFFSNTYGQQPNRLKVFIDCSDTRCDMSYFQSEINVIDFYRDRLLSDVHVLITSRRNASQGRAYQMIFYGQNGFEGQVDTLKFDTPPNSTSYEQRETVLNKLKAGLLPMVVQTSAGSAVSINMKAEESFRTPTESSEEIDRWNYWVYRLSGSGNINLDKIYRNSRLRWNASASRVTKEKRIVFYYYGNYNSSSYEFDGDNGPEKVVVTNQSQGLYHLYAIALTDHLAVGYEGSYRNDTFSNFKYRLTLSPGIEYSFFPYEEFNNRFFTVRYSAGMYAGEYLETTIYDKVQEVLPQHSLEVNMSFNQKWGNMGMGLKYSSFLHDMSLNNINLRSDLEMRITGGLSFDVRVQGGLVHDQINLPAGEATEEEILTRRRQLKSKFNVRFDFGLSYRFGSKLNNFVNPIFDD